MAGIRPTTKKVSEIEGIFVVPSYQRGYRWGTDEVVRLLDDIYLMYQTEQYPVDSSRYGAKIRAFKHRLMKK